MNGPAGAVLVIGVGNVLLRDDGVGVHVVEALGRLAERDPAALPPGTRLLEGGTRGMDLLHRLEGATALVLVDAVDLGQAPGTVSVLRGDRIAPAIRRARPSRGGGVEELLATARLLGLLPREVALVGIQAAEVDAGTTLSRTVSAALPAAVEATRSAACDLASAGGVAGAGFLGTMP